MMRRIHAVIARWLGLLVLAGIAVACGDPASRGEAPRILRAIETDPTTNFDAGDAFDLVEVERHVFDRPEALAEWDTSPTVRLGDEALIVPGIDRISTAWGRPASDVDVVRVEVSAWSAGRVRVFWDRPEVVPIHERSLEFTRDDLIDGRWLVAEVGAHPGWSGRIEAVGVKFAAPQHRRLLVHRVELLRRQPSTERLAEWAGQAVEIELDHERRDGYVAVPGRPVEWAVTVPKRATLNLGFGVEAGASAGLVFRGVARSDDGTDPSTLFEQRLEPDQAGVWHDLRVPLDAWVGRVMTVDLAVESDDPTALAFWSTPVVHSAGGRRSPNILLISLDTLRPDHLPFYGYERDTAPNLGRWAESAVVFERAVASSPWTLPSHLSMFTGLDALEHGIHDRLWVGDGFVMLAEMLRAQGYRTGAVTGGGFLDPAFGLDQGFEHYRYWPDRPGATSSAELQSGIARSLAWLRQSADAPWFLFVHSYEIHAPYDARSPYFEAFHGGEIEYSIGYGKVVSAETGYQITNRPEIHRPGEAPTPLPDDERQTLVDLYDSGIAFADHHVARLLDWLESTGQDEETLVIVTSDHGEALGEQGLSGHVYNYDFNLLVPLVLRLPGGQYGGLRIDRQVSTAQLPATILDLVGLPPYPGLPGPSLRPALEGRPPAERHLAWSYSAAANRGVSLRVDNRWKLIYQNSALPPVGGRRELFDLAADPTESTNLIADPPPALDGLHRWMADKLQERAVGARIELINASTEPFRGLFTGPDIAASRLKVPLTSPRPVMHWDAALVGTRFDVAPGERVELTLEPVPNPFFDVTVEHADGTSLWNRVRPDERPTLWSLERRAGTWGPGAASDEPPEQAIRVRWFTDNVHLGDDPSLGDAELRRQLEALGYIQ